MMSKASGPYRLLGLASLCLIALFVTQKYGNPLRQEIVPVVEAETTSKQQVLPTADAAVPKAPPVPSEKIHKPISKTAEINKNNHISPNVERRTIDTQRKIIAKDMHGYQYPNGKYNISASKLQDLLIENNGKPIRSVIVTSWRSGSTFFGDIINAHPANFYHYEPLLDYSIVQIRGPPLANSAVKRIKALLNCEFEELDNYIKYGSGHPIVFDHNTHLWKQCEAHKGLCYDKKFLTDMCKLFPFQSMKIVRVRLRIAQQLLQDEKLAVRLVLLVRDPRGTMQSRNKRYWCPMSPDCSDPALLCADLVSDYQIAVELQKKYPDRFRVIRYEDLAKFPYENVEELYKFYGLYLHPNVRKFLDTHTKGNSGGPNSTFRNSKDVPFHWKTDLTFKEVQDIQRSCATAMQYWGYVPATNATHQKEFNPVKDYELKL